MKILAFFIFFLTLPIIKVHSQESAEAGNGLEIEDYKNLTVGIEQFSNYVLQIGLTKDRILTHAELRLRQAGLKIDINHDLAYLTIDIMAVASSFNIVLRFNRPVSYSVGKSTKSCWATTWNYYVTGTHGNDPDYILKTLDTLFDKFLNEYLKANAK